MKKLLPILLIALLFITACSSNRFSINPSGMPTLSTPTPEAYEQYDYTYAEPIPAPITPVVTPIAADSHLRLSMRQPITLNPLLNEDITVAKILRLIFEPLVILDENFRPTSHLAELEFASDFSGARLTIRNDAFWSDGMPITSDDLIFSINILRNAPANAIYRSNVENIAEITRINSRAVQVYFYQPTMCAGKSLNFPIIPQHHYANRPWAETDMNPLGNAPFKFESYTPMRNVRLVKNPYGFRSRLSQINEVEVIFLPDTQTMLYAFDQGRIDAIHMPLTEWVRHHSVRQINHEIFPAMYFEFVGFNFEREIFNNVQIRRGIAHAFNIDHIIHSVYLDQAVRATSPIHPYSFAAADIPVAEYDPDRARILLSGIYQPLKIIANADNPQRISIANNLTASLNAIGILATADILTYEEYLERIENGDFDLFVGGVNLNFAPDVQFFFNGGFFMEDTMLEAAWSATRYAFMESLYLQAMTQFQEAFADRLPVISLAFRHSAMLTGSRVVQNSTPAPDNAFGWVSYWNR